MIKSKSKKKTSTKDSTLLNLELLTVDINTFKTRASSLGLFKNDILTPGIIFYSLPPVFIIYYH
jgi:hypothetical protein